MRFEVSKSAALGAALRAAHAFLVAEGAPAPWSEVLAGLADPVQGSTVEPDAAAAKVYDEFVQEYSRREAEVLARLG